MLTSLIRQMPDEAFQRSRIDNEMVLDGKCLTPYAQAYQERSFCAAGKLIVDAEIFDRDSFTFVVHSSQLKASYSVLVTAKFTHKCD